MPDPIPSVTSSPSDTYDVIIVGAGLSGINAAYRLQTAFPGLRYTLLESRATLGGTWDLFRYPGVRSDSDLYTLGFPWRPWHGDRAIADGAFILDYMREAAVETGIHAHIQCRRRVTAAAWTDARQTWALTVVDIAEEKQPKQILQAKYVIWATGYYNYDEALPARIPGIDDFRGPRIHPQFWPEELDYRDKNVAIIGSGATAVTLVPNLAPHARKVTVIQRSPGYVLAVSRKEAYDVFCRRYLPSYLAARLIRWKNLLIQGIFYLFTQAYPALARRFLRSATESKLPARIPHDPHFKPSYNVWRQRLCIAPGGDYFRALSDGKADIVTDTIETVTADGIRMTSGTFVPADIIVTATGLKILVAGGATITVNSRPINPSEETLWRGMMLTGLPNATIIIGYTSASWTLGADMTANLFVRLIGYMRRHGYGAMRPQVEAHVQLKPRSWTQFQSTYLEEAKGRLPRCGDRGPWKPRDLYLFDYLKSMFGSLTRDLVFEKDVAVTSKKDE